MRKLGKVLALSPRQWWGLVQAYGLLVRARWVSHRLKGASSLPVGHSAVTDQGPPLTDRQRQSIAEEVRLIDIASRHPFEWALCLQRSLALIWWLEKRRVHADLRIGVRKESERVVAHAWVEYQGKVLNDGQRATATFAPLSRAGSSARGPGQHGERP